MSVGQTQFFSSAFLTFHGKSILDHDGDQSVGATHVGIEPVYVVVRR